MRFAAPLLLWWLAVVPLVAALIAAASILRRRALRRFAGGAGREGRFLGQVSAHRRAVKAILLLAALAAAVLAAARPQWGAGVEPVTRKGVDVVVLIDTSRSMAAADVPPDRIGAARHAAASLIDRLGGDRVALVTFAGKGAIACPLTVDHAAVTLFLDAVDVETTSVPGTALADAAETAIRAFGPRDAAVTRGRAVVLFSDGEDHEGGLETAIESLRKAGVTVFAVGCGTERGAPIPLPASQGAQGGYKKDREGRLVTTRLDAATLTRLALETGGRYYRSTPSETEVEEIAKAISGMDAAESGTVLRTRYRERFQWPLAFAILALAVEALIPDRKRVREVA